MVLNSFNPVSSWISRRDVVPVCYLRILHFDSCPILGNSLLNSVSSDSSWWASLAFELLTRRRGPLARAARHVSDTVCHLSYFQRRIIVWSHTGSFVSASTEAEWSVFIFRKVVFKGTIDIKSVQQSFTHYTDILPPLILPTHQNAVSYNLITILKVKVTLGNMWKALQRGPSARSPGFEDDDFGNSSCCWAVTAISYCPSRHLQLTEKT